MRSDSNWPEGVDRGSPNWTGRAPIRQAHEAPITDICDSRKLPRVAYLFILAVVVGLILLAAK